MSTANPVARNTGSGGNVKPAAKVDIGKQLFPSNQQAAMWYNMSVQNGATPQNAYSQVRNQMAQRASTAPIFPQNGNGPNPSMNPMVTQPMGTGSFDPWDTSRDTYYNPANGAKLGGVSMGTGTESNSQVIHPGSGNYGQLFSGTGSSYNSQPQMGYGTLYGGLVDERFSDGVQRTTPQSQLDVSLASGMNAQDRFTLAKINKQGGYGWNPGTYPVYGPNGPATVH